MLGLCLLLLAIWATACGTSGPAPAPQVTGRPLGDSFVAVEALGFPVVSKASVTGTTPQGATTVDATTDTVGRLTASVPVPDGYQGPLDVKVTVGGTGGDDDRHRRRGPRRGTRGRRGRPPAR